MDFNCPSKRNAKNETVEEAPRSIVAKIGISVRFQARALSASEVSFQSSEEKRLRFRRISCAARTVDDLADRALPERVDLISAQLRSAHAPKPAIDDFLFRF
jgi:hypothetical protein